MINFGKKRGALLAFHGGGMSVFWLGSCRSTVMMELTWRGCWCEFRGGSCALAVCTLVLLLILIFVPVLCCLSMFCLFDTWQIFMFCSNAFAGVLCKQGHLFCCLLLLLQCGWSFGITQTPACSFRRSGRRIKSSGGPRSWVIELKSPLNSVLTWCRVRFLEYRFHSTIVEVVIY